MRSPLLADQGSGSGISAATLVQGPGNRPLTRVTGRKSECLPGTGLPGRSSSSSSSSSSSTTRGPGGVPTTDADNDTDGTQVAGAQAAGPQAAATQPQFAAAAVAPPTNAQIEQQVFDQVNTFRVQNGLGALIRWPGADNQVPAKLFLLHGIVHFDSWEHADTQTDKHCGEIIMQNILWYCFICSGGSDQDCYVSFMHWPSICKL